MSKNSLESQGVLQAVCLGTVKKLEDFLCVGKQNCCRVLRQITRQNYKSPILFESFTSPFWIFSSLYISSLPIAEQAVLLSLNLSPGQSLFD